MRPFMSNNKSLRFETRELISVPQKSKEAIICRKSFCNFVLFNGRGKDREMEIDLSLNIDAKEEGAKAGVRISLIGCAVFL